VVCDSGRALKEFARRIALFDDDCVFHVGQQVEGYKAIFGTSEDGKASFSAFKYGAYRPIRKLPRHPFHAFIPGIMPSLFADVAFSLWDAELRAKGGASLEVRNKFWNSYVTQNNRWLRCKLEDGQSAVSAEGPNKWLKADMIKLMGGSHKHLCTVIKGLMRWMEYRSRIDAAFNIATSKKKLQSLIEDPDHYPHAPTIPRKAWIKGLALMEDMAFFYGIIPVNENLTVAVANIQQRQFSGLRIFLAPSKRTRSSLEGSPEKIKSVVSMALRCHMPRL